MGDVRISQVAVETLAQPDPDLGVSQVVVETFASGLPASSLRVSHVAVETFSTVTAVAPSGFNALLVSP